MTAREGKNSARNFQGPNVVMDRLSVVQDSDEDQDRITLSLGILDEQLSEEEEYSEQPSKRDRKSNSIQNPDRILQPIAGW